MSPGGTDTVRYCSVTTGQPPYSRPPQPPPNTSNRATSRARRQQESEVAMPGAGPEHAIEVC